MRTWKTAKELKQLYYLIPLHMIESIVGYREQGWDQGGFGGALLSNDLMGALGNADETNRHAMFEWAMLLYNDMPQSSFGSPENYNDWCKIGGLEGLEKQRKENLCVKELTP